MLHNDLFYTLALLRVEGVGDKIAKKLIHHFGSAQEVFSAPKKEVIAIDGLGNILFKKLQKKSCFLEAEKEINFIEKQSIRPLYYQDNRYPEKLKHCFDSPVILFQSGTVDLRKKKIVSIVGTRQITNYGKEMTKKIIEDLAPLNPVIVSGFAYGVDIVAHQAALENGLQTIAVLAHGLNQIYPKSYKKYCSELGQNGGFLTEFWSNSNPDRENFVKRNRIVAGMSEATVVVESAEKGGSLITAQIANEYNRDVFAVPGRTTDKLSQGCNTLIKTQRAHLLTSAADLIYLLNWQNSEPIQKPIQKQLFVSLSDDEQKIYDYLSQHGKELLDSIALTCEFPIYKLAAILVNMELKGLIRPLPGKFFEAI